jgi:hypothetical protein
MRRRSQEIDEWNKRGEEPVDVDVFAREILPGIQGIPLRQLAEATGLSVGYCALIRRGERVPHPRHWHSLWRPADSRSHDGS